MSRKEGESVPMRNVSVGLYCHTDDNELEEKIRDIKDFLIKNGGTCEVSRKTVSRGDANILTAG